MKQFKVKVSKSEFDALDKTYTWWLPLDRRYTRLIPSKAFAIGEDDVVLVEGPTSIRFRKRHSLKTVTKDIRLKMLIHDEEDGIEFVYIKLYLK